MVFVRCPTCQKDKRTYNKKFNCCGQAHSTNSNLVFKPVENLQSSNAKSEEPIKNEGGEASEKSNVSQSPQHTQTESEVKPVSREPVSAVKPSKAVHDSSGVNDNYVTDVDLEIEDKEITEDEAKEKYECHHDECNAYFNKDEIIKDGDELKCPNCKEVIGEA